MIYCILPPPIVTAVSSGYVAECQLQSCIRQGEKSRLPVGGNDTVTYRVSGKKPFRSSNIEFLRIVAMSMILIGHILTHGLAGIVSWQYYVPITTFCACGVNLFFMISGYFGIKLSIKSLFKFICTILFFEIINIILILLAGSHLSTADVLNIILFPVSKSPYWFLQVYLLIMVCAPVINMGLDNMSPKMMRRFVVLFTFFTVYSCGLGHNVSNPNGYTFVQGVYMYTLASYIRRQSVILNVSRNICLLIALMLLAIGSVALYYTHHTSFTAYNSVINIFASVFIFLYFSKLKIRSGLINAVASASLGCYLLQDGLFGIRHGYGYIANIYVNNTLVSAILLIVLIFISYWLFSYLLMYISNFISRQAWSFATFISMRLPAAGIIHGSFI